MRNQFQNEKLKFYIGDVRDRESVDRAIRGSDFVFHAAALKQVPSCEFFPDQAVLTNVIGSGNVISSAIEHSVNSLVCLSTDKAVYPINAMGMSKSLMEKYVLANSRDSRSNKTVLSITRYGNVMMSRGSVIPLFVKQALSGENLTLTNPEMTRFLMSLDESVQLVEHAFLNANPGDLFVRKAPACTIETLAGAIWRIIHPDSDPKFNLIGTRHGEKLFESLLSSEEFTKAEDQKDYFKVGMDSRTLDYSLYFENGSSSKIQDPYTSHNTKQLNESDVVNLLLGLPSFNKLLDGQF
jgi:UDP-glucose 4-epimerase